MKRKTMFVLAAVVLGAAVIIFVSTSDFPAQPADVVGTIGATDGDRVAGVEQAHRYRTQQIGDEAVTLDNPEIQELLQDAEVIRLIQNPEFQRAMLNDELRRALMSEELQRAVLQAEFSRALGGLQVLQMDAELSRQMVEFQERELFGKRMFLNDDLARLVAANADLARVLVSNEGFARAIAMDESLGRALVANVDLQRLFSNIEVLSVMADMQRAGIFDTVGFGRILLSDEAFSLMANADSRDDFFGRAASIEVTAQ
jgi:hypothetical protein